MLATGWIDVRSTAFRFALFAACAAYAALGWRIIRPGPRALPVSFMAAWVQFALGVALDLVAVRAGAWAYRPMELTLAGVPLDLHLEWAMLWGLTFVWAYGPAGGWRRGPSFSLSYVLVWSAGTCLFDLLVVDRLPFLAHRSNGWIVCDFLVLFILLGATLWVFRSAMRPPRSRVAESAACLIRATVYIGSLAYLFYVYIPGDILTRTGGPDAGPLLGMGSPLVLAIMLAPPLLLGAWASFAFAVKGRGTAIPFDPPRRLVTTGPYAFVRNPMQISGIWLAIILGFYYPSPYLAFYALDMVLASLVLFRIWEESDMAARFGRGFEEYRDSVRNWLPRRTRFVSDRRPGAS